MQSKVNLAKKLLYHTRVPCLDISKFASFISSEFEYCSTESLLEEVRTFPRAITDDNSAAKFLIAQALSDFGVEEGFTIGADEFDIESIQKLYDQIKDEFRAIGLFLHSYPVISLVDEYPYPFQNVKGVALAPDATDRERYGIPYCILIRQHSVDPTILPVLIAHELVHFFIRDDGMLARGLEEGLADFLAFFVIGPKLMDRLPLERYFVSKRITPQIIAPRFRTYLDYIRLVLYLYSFEGLSSLVNLVNSGRAKIKETENELLAQINSNENFTFSRIHELTSPNILGRGWALINNHPMFEIIGPTAYCYIKYRNIHDISELFTFELKAIHEEIEEQLFGCVVGENGVLEFEDFDTLSKNSALRFDLR